ncbi:MAG: hypothetical protein U5N86_03860 [Planctomycetota bacterium]|nr:hypothetical protein [Planctomycetota bacterium]
MANSQSAVQPVACVSPCRPSRHRTVITAVLWLLFWGLLFLLFDFGWNFLERDELALIRDQISFVVWSLFFFPLMIMIGFSTCVISFSSYFQNRETRFLLTQPVSEAAVFFHKSREATGFASWATLFISLPIVITFGLNNAEGILFYPAAIAGFVPFVVLSASIGAIVAVLVGLLLPRARKLLIVLSVLAAGIGIWKIIRMAAGGKGVAQKRRRTAMGRQSAGPRFRPRFRLPALGMDD